MFWKLFTIGFVLDPRTIRKVNHIRGATIFAEPVPSEDGNDFLNKITGKEGVRSLKDLLEKKVSDKKKNIFKSGRDERYDILYNETSRYDIIFNITQFTYQMNLLRTLESSQISVIEKIAAIEQYKKDTSDGGYVQQLKSGGLWKDWNTYL